jgi:hypothetical protein
MTDYAAQARALAAHSPTVTSLKRSAPSRPAPVRPAGWEKLSPMERRARQFVGQAQEQAQDQEQAQAKRAANLPSNWLAPGTTAQDRRAWMLEHGKDAHHGE